MDIIHSEIVNVEYLHGKAELTIRSVNDQGQSGFIKLKVLDPPPGLEAAEGCRIELKGKTILMNGKVWATDSPRGFRLREKSAAAV